MPRPDHVFTDADIREWLRSEAIGKQPFFKAPDDSKWQGQTIEFWEVIMYLWADRNHGFKGISLRGMPLKQQMKYLKHRAAGLHAAWVNRVETYSLPDSLPILMDHGGTPRWTVSLSENWRCEVRAQYEAVTPDPENPHDQGHRAGFHYHLDQRHVYPSGEMFLGKASSSCICIPDEAGWLPEDGTMAWVEQDVRRGFAQMIERGDIVDEFVDRRTAVKEMKGGLPRP